MAVDTVEYIQHLFYFDFSFSSNAFLSLLDNFTKKSPKSTICIAVSFSRMNDSPFCDDYFIVHNTVKN